MQRRAVLGVFFMLMFSGMAAAADISAGNSAQSLTTQHAVLTQLENGLQVLVLRDTRFPLVSTRLYIHAGSAYEDEDQAGISHMLEHMVFKGTKRRPKGETSRMIEAAGGYINAATGYDDTVYIVDLPARHWKLGLDAVCDMTLNPAFDPAELEAEQKVVLSELDMRMKDRPQGQLFEKLLTETLRGTPYDRPIIGTKASVQNLTVKDLQDYTAKLYQPQNMLLVVAGNVQPDEVLAEAKKLFAPYVNNTALAKIAPYDAFRLPLAADGSLRLKPSVVVTPGKWNKVYFAAAFPVPGFTDYTSTPMDVLAYILGGDSTSLLYRTFKYEKQLVDSIAVSNTGFERIGLFAITAELDADKVAQFWDELVKMLADIDPAQFSAAEIERAKINLEDDFYRSRETLPGLASQLGQFQFYFASTGAEKTIENTISAIHDTGRESLADILHTWINPAHLSIVAVHPEKTVMPDFSASVEKNWKYASQGIAASAQGKSGAPEIVDMGKGSKVVLLPDTTMPYISAQLVFSGGDMLLQPDQQGLASLAASTLTRGTAKHGSQEIRDLLSAKAASLGAAASRRSFGLSCTMPARFSNEIFALLGEIMQSPAFAPEETARAIHDQIASIQTIADHPLPYVMRRKLPPFLFPNSVYGYLQLGEPEKVQTYTPDMLRAFWQAQQQRPFVLSVAGDFDREKILAFARSLPAAQQTKAELPLPVWGKDKHLEVKVPGRNQAHLLLLFKTVSDTDAASPAFALLEAALGGMSGPLFQDLRDDQGLGYTVMPFSQQTEKSGFLGFYIGTLPEKMDQAEASFKKILARLTTELLPEADLNRGRNQMEGDYYRSMQSLGSRAGEAAMLTLLERPLSFSRDQIAKAREVSAEQLRELARQYLKFENAWVIKVLP